MASTDTSIERGNVLGSRPCVRQSKLYRTNESGNAMKALMGYDDIVWETEQQQGVFAGRGVYDAEAEMHTRSSQSTSSEGSPDVTGGTEGSAPRQFPVSAAAGGDAATAQGRGSAYPHPGSEATCDGCAKVVDRYYHCNNCTEDVQLFDLCVECCVSPPTAVPPLAHSDTLPRPPIGPLPAPLPAQAALYLKQGAPHVLARVNAIDHPTHDVSSHKMVHVQP